MLIFTVIPAALVLYVAFKFTPKKRDGLEFLRIPKEKAKWYLLLNKGGK